MTPLRLTDEQLNQVMRTAVPIPLDLRDEYLQRAGPGTQQAADGADREGPAD